MRETGLGNERIEPTCAFLGFTDGPTLYRDDMMEPQNTVQTSENSLFDYTNQYKISGPARI